jgi:glucarate dehydratase
MMWHRREWLKQMTGGALGAGLIGSWSQSGVAQQPASVGEANGALTITGLKITPIALPDPPILAAGGCHGPYFLRNIVQLETDAGIVGIGETRGGAARTERLEQARDIVVGQNAFAYRKLAGELLKLGNDVYAGIELACLDACGRATGRRLCELLGGPVREEVEFAAYLFYRYAADHRALLKDSRIVDDRGQGAKALDDWGEVRTPEAMAEMAEKFHRRWGFRNFKLKAGVLPPDVELASMREINARFEGKFPLRIDPNGRWTVETAVRVGEQLKSLPLEYYEDPVVGQEAMAEVRKRTGHVMSTNMCVTRFEHVPSAVELKPVDVVLGDHHGWGGIPAFQELGRICEIFGWGLSQHSNNHAGVTMAAMTHVGAVVPQLTWAGDTHYVWLIEGADVIQGPNIPIRNGQVAVPNGPGVGVDLDPDKLARAHEVYRKCGMRERNDAETMRMVVPGWERTMF